VQGSRGAVLTIVLWGQVRHALDLEEQDARNVAVARVLVAAHLLGLLLQAGHAQSLAPLLALLGLLRLVLRLVGALVILGVGVVTVGAQQHVGLVLVGAGRAAGDGDELLEQLLRRRRRVARVDDGELDLDLARDDRLLLAGAARLERVPARLLLGAGVEREVLEDDVKLAHVVLAEAVLVPAADLEQQALLAHNGQVEYRVPFGVERLVDGRRGLLRVAEGQHEVLQRLSALSPMQRCAIPTPLMACACQSQPPSGHSPGQRCHCGPLQRGSCPAAWLAPALSRGERRSGAPHLQHMCPQHQPGLCLLHVAFGAALSARGDARGRRGAGVVGVLEAGGERQLGRERRTRHRGYVDCIRRCGYAELACLAAGPRSA
jgi:hypothetical protein